LRDLNDLGLNASATAVLIFMTQYGIDGYSYPHQHADPPSRGALLFLALSEALRMYTSATHCIVVGLDELELDFGIRDHGHLCGPEPGEAPGWERVRVGPVLCQA